jgi:hypothetical protein
MLTTYTRWIYHAPMINNKEAKVIVSIRVPVRVKAWLQREADKGHTTASRIASWYLERVARKSQ